MFSDWFAFYWPQLQNPFNLVPEIFNNPWLFVLLYPLNLLSSLGAVILVQIASIFIISKLGFSLKISPIRILMVLFSPPFIWTVFLGQLDGLIIGAYLLPAELAIILAMFKPQTALAAGIHAVRQKPWVLVIAIIIAISATIIWGWPFNINSDVGGLLESAGIWNWSLWPYGLILLPLLFIKKEDIRYGMFASPFMFPYAGLQSLIGPMIAAATWPWQYFIPLWLLSWVHWYNVFAII